MIRPHRIDRGGDAERDALRHNLTGRHDKVAAATGVPGRSGNDVVEVSVVSGVVIRFLLVSRRTVETRVAPSGPDDV